MNGLVVAASQAEHEFFARIAIDRSRFLGGGLLLDAENELQSVSVTNTEIADVHDDAIWVLGDTTVTVDRCVIKDFGDNGIFSSGARARVYVSNSVIRSTIARFDAPLITGTGGFLCSFGNNAISDPVFGVTSCATQ